MHQSPGHAQTIRLHAPVAVVASCWYTQIMEGLVEGALRCLDEAKVSLSDGSVGRACARLVRVPGSFELPQACAMLGHSRAESGEAAYSGIAALGCLIRGETSHYDVLCHAVGNALAALSVQLAIAHRAAPVALSFGVLTCESLAQAEARSGFDERNKGYEAMQALLGMLSSAAVGR